MPIISSARSIPINSSEFISPLYTEVKLKSKDMWDNNSDNFAALLDIHSCEDN